MSGCPTDGTLAISDYRVQAVRGDAVFRPAWAFKGNAVETILDIIKHEPHPWIHACCGAATIPGEDVRVDLYHPSGLPIDVQDLDLHYQNAGVVFLDPPYGKKEWPLDVRARAISACWRALRPGGLLVVHSPWQPTYPPEWMQLEEPVWMRQDHRLSFPGTPVLLCAYRKNPEPIRGPQRNGARVQGRKTVEVAA